MPRRHRLPIPVPIAVAIAVGLALAHTAEIRQRADAALGQGVPEREAALARGFVLGEDDEVDPATAEDFRRAGLSHLLAVSGQNVALLALLAMPLLAALGMPLRTRLVWVLGLIAAYVPLAGAGPSIARAGVMGGLAVIATLAGRRASRLYALAVAAIVTLAVDPAVASDVGWQLSFAAVLGILLMAAPLREAIVRWTGARGGLPGALAEGAALTVAATLATAPLIAFHFGELSTVTLLANLLVMPAVAPAMWLGMLAAAAGQLPGFPVEALNFVDALLLAYVAQVAIWCARPSWAMLHVEVGVAGLAGWYAATVASALLLTRHRRNVFSDRSPGKTFRRWRAGLLAGILGFAIAAVWAAGSGGLAGAPAEGLRVTVLNVGQGDAILLQPAGAEAVLVDGGPPGDDLAVKLRDAGVARLGAAIVTHDQSDHAGGVEELLGSIPVGRLLYGALSREMKAEAIAAGADPRRIAAGSVLRSGGLRLDVLWPPRILLTAGEDGAGEDPNRLALVMVARWHDFSMLLTADAEAEVTPIDPGPVDVLKVSHHGSDDAGLDDLLDRSAPRLAVISVGKGNSYGHPTPATMATLAAHGIRTLRTDQDGSVVLDVGRDSLEVGTGG